MTTLEAIEVIQIYNTKADELSRHSLTKKIFEEPSGIHIEWNREQGMRSRREGSQGDSMQSFKIIYRLFTFMGQGRRGETTINFRAMPDVYKSLPQTPKIVQIAQKLDDVIAGYQAEMQKPLSASSSINIKLKSGLEPTRPELIDHFLYADDFHIDKDKRDQLDEWKNFPALFDFLEDEFVRTMAWVMDEAIFWNQSLNYLAVKELYDMAGASD
jgi:hypothetical protein